MGRRVHDQVDAHQLRLVRRRGQLVRMCSCGQPAVPAPRRGRRLRRSHR